MMTDRRAIAREESRPQLHDGRLDVPVHHMRGGTSTGIVLYRPALPSSPELVEEIVRHVMGVPLTGAGRGNRQLHGLGRGPTTSNKVFLIDHDDGVEADFTSTLLQLSAESSAIDWSVNCGNMSSAFPLYLLERGLLDAALGETAVRVRNTNTGVITDFRVRTPSGTPFIPADTEIPGVMGLFPGVEMSLRDPVGAKTGRLFPTGASREIIGGIEISCVDVAVPMVILRANDVGLSGHESVEEIAATPALLETLRGIWTEAGRRMRLRASDGALLTEQQLARSQTTPKVCLVAAPQSDGNIAARYFTPQTLHASMAVTGGCCLAAAALIPGTIAHQVAVGVPHLSDSLNDTVVRIEHPVGVLRARVRAALIGDHADIPLAAYERSAQILLAGNFRIHHPSSELVAHYS